MRWGARVSGQRRARRGAATGRITTPGGAGSGRADWEAGRDGYRPAGVACSGPAPACPTLLCWSRQLRERCSPAARSESKATPPAARVAAARRGHRWPRLQCRERACKGGSARGWLGARGRSAQGMEDAPPLPCPPPAPPSCTVLSEFSEGRSALSATADARCGTTQGGRCNRLTAATASCGPRLCQLCQLCQLWLRGRVRPRGLPQLPGPPQRARPRAHCPESPHGRSRSGVRPQSPAARPGVRVKRRGRGRRGGPCGSADRRCR